MNKKYRRPIAMCMGAAALLTAHAATLAGPGHGVEHCRESAQALQRADKSLAEVIKIAEKFTGGTAVEVMVLPVSVVEREYLRHGYDMGDRANSPDRMNDRDRDDWRNNNRNSNNDNNNGRDNATGDDTARDNQRTNPERLNDGARRDRNAQGMAGFDPANPHAAVTCVVNNVQVRRVMVDLKTGKPVGVSNDAWTWDDSVNTTYPAADRGMRDRNDAYEEADRTLIANHRFIKASQLLNLSATNHRGENLGDIEDIAVDVTAHRAAYGVLQRGGFLGIGDELYAIPIDQFSNVYGDNVRLDLTEAELEARDGFDQGNWPSNPDYSWTGSPRNSDQAISGQVTKASSIIGMDVHATDDKEIGEVRDLIIDARSGRIAYFIVGGDNGRVAVPGPAISRAPGDDDTLRLAGMSKTQFDQQPTISDRYDPDWYSNRWNSDVYKAYNVSPYWHEAGAQRNIREQGMNERGMNPDRNNNTPDRPRPDRK